MPKPDPLATAEPSSSMRALLVSAVQRHPERPAISYRLESTSEAGLEQPPTWRTLSWHEVAHLVLEAIAALERELGSARIVAVLADTDARYPLLELAVGISGRVLQPLYVEATDTEVRRALTLSGADALVVGRSQLARVRGAGFNLRLSELTLLIELPGVNGAAEAALSPDVEPFDTRRVRQRLAALAARPPEAALLYLQSTGTTGPARVIEISEAALLHAVHAIRGETSQRFPRFLSFLPTAHISERLLTLYVSLALVGHTWYGGGLGTLAADLRACRPTAFLAPPLLFESVRRGASAQASGSALGRKLLSAVQRSADALLASGSSGGARRSWAAKFFGRQLKQQLGLDEVEDTLSGTAPMSAELHAWCEAAGLPLRIVYGQTEVAGATTITARHGACFGSVGAPLRAVELRISEDDELLVRSSSAFTRYVESPVTLTETPTLERAWLSTGDRAKWLANGELVLLGRVQSLFRAADGARVDTAHLADEIRSILGDADIAFHRPLGEFTLQLYVAVHPPKWQPGAPAPLTPAAENSALGRQLAALLVAIDAGRAVSSVALFTGAFGQNTGEIGPTGKPRPWRIHELRASALKPRDATVSRADDLPTPHP